MKFCFRPSGFVPEEFRCRIACITASNFSHVVLDYAAQHVRLGNQTRSLLTKEQVCECDLGYPAGKIVAASD